MPARLGASGSVRASSRHQSACSAPLAQSFWPLTTISSLNNTRCWSFALCLAVVCFSLVARVVSFRYLSPLKHGSEEAQCAGVIDMPGTKLAAPLYAAFNAKA